MYCLMLGSILPEFDQYLGLFVPFQLFNTNLSKQITILSFKKFLLGW
jgi:hypothetical protein